MGVKSLLSNNVNRKIGSPNPLEQKGNPFPHTTSYIATLREHGITMQEAVDKMVDQIAVQIANIF